MKKKFLSLILAIFCFFPVAFMLSACDKHTHTYTENVSNAYLKSEATCTESAIYYKSCECGEKSTQTFEVGEPLGHDYFYSSRGDGTHEKICANDQSHSDIENCSGQAASCGEQAYCEICQEYYGEPGGHRFVLQVTTDMYLKRAATCSVNAQYYYSCECGEIGEEYFDYGEPLEHQFTNYISNYDATCEEDGTKTAICNYDGCNEEDTIADVDSAKGHSYGAWASNGNGKHVQTCSNDHSHKISENCSGGTATCKQKAICSVCNSEYGNKLSHIFVDKECENCGVKEPSEGLLLTLSSNGKYYIVSGIGTCEDIDIVIPDTHNNLPVTHINDEAFKNETIKSVWMPYSITNIGDSSFYGCTSLENVTMGEGVVAIGERSFQNCSNLITVTIDDNVTSIGAYAFANCNNLISVNIGNGITNIQNYTFSNCTNLEDVKIGKKVTSIGASAFLNCDDISSVNFAGTIDAWAQISFENIDSSPLGNAKLYIDNNLVTEVNLTIATKVSKYAFSGCTSITSVTLGDSVETIEVEAFKQCSNLDNVTIGVDVASIGAEAFFGCNNLTNITIPGNVKVLANKVFASCTNLANVTIIEGVETIGEAVFQGCGVTSITIPNSVTNLGASAFANCDSLSNITIGSGLTAIQSESFSNCGNLTSVTIGSNVETIEEKAFYSCTKLESLTIPNKVYAIVDKAFANCTSLTNLTLSSEGDLSISSDVFEDCDAFENVYYIGDINNWVQLNCLDVLMGYDYEDCTARNLYLNGQTLTEVNITTATYINSYAFICCNTLISVTIGDSVESIGSYAFEKCTNLTSVTIGNGVQTIERWAFTDCSKLKTLTLGNSIETIGEDAFSSAISLESVIIPDSVTTIEAGAFMLCTSLSNITIGNSVETIGNYAFEGSIITTLTIPNSVKTIGDYAFGGANITTLNIPDNVTSIGADAFTSCNDLISVTIGNGVKTIGTSAFSYCDSLTSVNFGNNVERIGQTSFYGCSSLTNIIIPDTVTEIGSSAFYECENLMSITIGSGVTYIGSQAFSGCLKLVEVINKSDLNITKGSTSNGSVGKNALNVKTEGTSDIVNVNNYLFYTVDSKNHLIGYTGSSTELTLPENYNGQSYEIYDYAFLNCHNAVSLIISDGVTSIGNNIFYYNNKLVSVTVGENVTNIAENAFFYCDRIVEVINYSSLNIELYDYSGNGYISANALKVKTEGTSDIVNVDDYLFCSLSGVNYLVGYKGTSTELTLPEDYKGQKYVIYRNAFANSDITSVIISKNVSLIESYAFANCLTLKTVILKDNTTRIAVYAFNQCPNIQYNEYSNACYLGNDINPYLYLIKAKSTDITSCEVNIGCKLIAGGAFYNCTKLTDIILNDSIQTIEGYVFSGCTSLTTISIPENIRHIEDYAFVDCSNLQYNEYDGALYLGNENNPYLWLMRAKSTDKVSYEINENCKKIAGGAFAFCYAERVFIPNSVEYIGKDSFYYCSSLRYAFYEGSQIEWSDIEKEDIDGSDSLTAETIYFYSETKPTTTGNYWHYVDGVITIWTNEE